MKYIFVCLFIGLLMMSCQPAETNTERIPPEVEELQYSLLPGGARVITGKLYNPSSKNIRNAQVQIFLFDEKNRKVSDMSVTVKDVSPGERKSFRQPVDVDLDIRGAKVKRVLVL